MAEDVFLRALIRIGLAQRIAPGRMTSGTIIIPDGRKLVVHSLRYTYVTRMRRELPVEMVSKMVGHNSVEMTDYYTDRAALEDAISGLSGAGIAADNFFS